MDPVRRIPKVQILDTDGTPLMTAMIRESSEPEQDMMVMVFRHPDGQFMEIATALNTSEIIGCEHCSDQVIGAAMKGGEVWWIERQDEQVNDLPTYQMIRQWKPPAPPMPKEVLGLLQGLKDAGIPFQVMEVRNDDIREVSLEDLGVTKAESGVPSTD